MESLTRSLNMIYKYLVLALSFILVTNLFSSCTSKSTEIDETTVFRYNEHKNIGSLDPAFAKDLADIWATNQLFNGLVQMDDSLNIQPSIATQWNISEDALNYTFTIRPDVEFHKHERFGKDSTRTVIAKDFEYSLFRLCDPKIASPGSWLTNNLWDIEVHSNTQLTIKLKQPDPSFLGKLTMKYCSVVPEELISHYGNSFRSNPIGTGPFQFKKWEENIKLVFRKNPHYFEKDLNGKQLPYLEAIAITFLPDKQSEFLQFSQGNIDFVSGLDASYKDEILTASGNLRDSYSDKVRMIRSPYLNTEYLAFYMETSVSEIQSELIRKAVNYGFDRKKMMTYLRNGIGIPAHGGFIPKGLAGFSEANGFSYNPELAKQLVQEFITKTNITTPTITLSTTGNYLSFCEFIQRELLKIGLQVKIDVMPASSLKSAKANGKLDFFRASWVADYPDAENYLSLYYSKNFAPNGPNYTHYKNSSFDDLYETAFNETNPKKRALLYKQMDSLVMKTTPIVPLFYDEVVRFSQKNVIGLGINPVNLLELKQVKKK